MQVEMLADVPYTLRPGMSPRIYGQARTGPNGTYFRKGARPDLPDDEAMQLIASGKAVACDGPAVKVVTVDEINAMDRA